MERKIADIEETIRARIVPHEEVLSRLNTINGNQLTAKAPFRPYRVQVNGEIQTHAMNADVTKSPRT